MSAETDCIEHVRACPKCRSVGNLARQLVARAGGLANITSEDLLAAHAQAQKVACAEGRRLGALFEDEILAKHRAGGLS